WPWWTAYKAPRNSSARRASRATRLSSLSAISGSEPMSAAKLKRLLTKGRVVSSKLEKAAELCDEWHFSEPSPATFVLRGRFHDLIHRGWADPQGVRADHYKLFHDGVRPPLNALVDLLAATPSADPAAEVENLVVAYRDSFPTTP